MLQAYIDDSGQGHGPVLILAGFIATNEQWAAFSDEWQDALDMGPAIGYMKMSEAAGFNGEFQGLSKESRNLKVARFYRIIEEYVQASIWASMPRDAFARIFAPAAKHHPMWANPYFLLLFDMVSTINRNRDQLGIDGNLEFVFDDQIHEKRLVREMWQFFKSDEADPMLKVIMGNEPKFRDDKRVLPLQAADINAWWTRHRKEKQMLGGQIPSFEFKTKRPMPSLSVEWNEQSLRRAYARIFYNQVPMEVLFRFGLIS